MTARWLRRLGRPQPRLLFVPPTGGGGRRARLRKGVLLVGRVVTAIAVLSGTLLGVTVSMEPARADLLCKADVASDPTNLGPETLNAGTTAWVPFLANEDVRATGPSSGKDKDPSWDGAQLRPNDYTLWEVVGPRGLKWSYSPQAFRGGKFNVDDPEQNFEEKCSVVDASGVVIAQMIFEISRFLAGLTIGLKQIATAEAPFKPFYDRQGSLIELLRDQLFIPSLAVGIMITGFWVALRMRRREDARETYAAVLGGAIIVILLVAALAGGNFRTLTEAVDKHTTDFNAGVLNLLANTGESEQASPCYIPTKPIPMAVAGQASPSYAPPPPDEDGRWDYLTFNKGKRVSSCMLYEMLLFNPWANGQFGTSDQLTAESFHFNTDEISDRDGYCSESPYRCKQADRPPGSKINIAIQQVIAQGYTRNETISYQTHRELYPPTTSPNRLQLWKSVQYAVANEHAQYYSTWKGAEPTGRMATAIGAAVVNLIMLIVVGFIAVLTIFWHGVFFVGWVLLPVAAAVAIFPPARRILRAVLGILVQAVFLRCVFGLVLVVLLGIMNAIQISDGSTALKIILMIIAALAIWKLLSALRSGALSPQIAQEAAQMGVLPSDEGVDRGFRSGRAMAGGVIGGFAATAIRRQYGRIAGGRAGAEAARAETIHRPGTPGYREDVRQGKRIGRVEGGRSQTRLGQARQSAEVQARRGYDRSTQEPGWQTHERDVQRQRIQREKRLAEEQRRTRQREREEERHQELINELREKERREE